MNEESWDDLWRCVTETWSLSLPEVMAWGSRIAINTTEDNVSWLRIVVRHLLPHALHPAGATLLALAQEALGAHDLTSLCTASFLVDAHLALLASPA